MIFIGQLAVLNPREGIVELLRNLPDLAIAHGELFTLPAKFTHGGNHRCRTCAKGLGEFSALDIIKDVRNGQALFFHLVPQLAGKGQHCYCG